MYCNISSPKYVYDKIKSKISNQVIISFFAAVIIGLITHTYGFINLMPNHDGIQTSLIHFENMLYQGRWFQKYVSLITSSYNMPWINGLISIFLLAIASSMIVYLFKINKSLNAIITVGFIVTFPTIASSFAYLYMTNAFVSALLLSVLAIWISRVIPKWGYIISPIFICLSLGIYQAYICLALALFVALNINYIIECKPSNTKIVVQIIKDLISLSVGVCLYYIILKILLLYSTTQLTNYQNIDMLNRITISNIVHRIIGAYKGFFDYFQKTLFGYYNPFTAYVHISVLFFEIMFALYIFIKIRLFKRIITSAIFIVLVAIFPVALYSMALLGAAAIHSLMTFSLCVLYVLYIKLSEVYSTEEKNINFRNISIWIMVIISIIVLYSNILLANKSYLVLQTRYNQTYAYATKLSMRIESNEDYYEELPVAIIGYTNFEHYIKSPLVGFELNNKYTIHKPDRYFNFFWDYIGANYTRVSDDILNEIVNSDKYLLMPIYPKSGSIKVVENVLIVKLGEPE